MISIYSKNPLTAVLLTMHLPLRDLRLVDSPLPVRRLQDLRLMDFLPLDRHHLDTPLKDHHRRDLLPMDFLPLVCRLQDPRLMGSPRLDPLLQDLRLMGFPLDLPLTDLRITGLLITARLTGHLTMALQEKDLARDHITRTILPTRPSGN